MKRNVVTFVGPRRIEVANSELHPPAPDQVIVQTQLSAISAGTELLLYRGEIPTEAASSRDPISQDLAYPTPYGYAAVGTVVECGEAVVGGWLGRRVFAFLPHMSYILARPAELLPIPDGMRFEDAAFLANAETAVGLVQDAAPVLGENALVFGQGVVGLLVASLLREFPLQSVVVVEALSRRIAAARDLGVSAVLDPSGPDFHQHALSLSGLDGAGFDVTLELSGNPQALQDAISLTRFSGRVVVGSWYGTKAVRLDLGGRFHRSRIGLVPSQVSTISPALAARWDKPRRFAAAWDAIRRIGPSKWVTLRLPVERAAEAYRTLDENQGESIQVLLEYRS